MRRRRDDRWSRVLVLLIFVMIAVLVAERVLDETRAGTTKTIVPPGTMSSQATLEATALPGEDYPFLPPTTMPQTPTLTPTQSFTATPPAPIVQIPIAEVLAETEILPVTRATPIGAVSGLIARCPVTGNQIQFLFYDLASSEFRSLSDPFNYLVPSQSLSELAYIVGAVQKGLSADGFVDFPIPMQWQVDQNFIVLGVSLNQQAILVQRFGGVDPGIYWMDTVTKENRLLFDWSGTLSEVQTVSQLDAVLLQLPDEQNSENLFLVTLESGTVEWLTQYESLSAKNGRISPNGRRLAYWTLEGVWLISLDGTFASLAFPAASHPAWSADSSRLSVVRDGVISISNFEGTQLETLVVGSYPQWLPDGSGIVYWYRKGRQCEWRLVSIENGQEQRLLGVENSLCQPNRPFSFSTDGQWLLGTLPVSTKKSESSGAAICDLTTGGCQFLSSSRGYTCDQAYWSTQRLPFVWDFSEDAGGWRRVQQVQDEGTTEGIWHVKSVGSFPVIASPINLGITSDLYTMLDITMRVDVGNEATLYIVTKNSRQYDDHKSFRFPLIADGEFHRYRFDLSTWPEWQGVVTGLRIRMTDSADANIALDQVKVFAEPD